MARRPSTQTFTPLLTLRRQLASRRLAPWCFGTAALGLALAACGGRLTGAAAGPVESSDAARLPAVFSESYVFLRASIGGRPALLLFDSGASGTVLSTRTVRELELAERGRRITFGLGTTAVQASIHEGVAVRLGATDILVPSVLTWQELELPSLGDERAEGIIGADLLHARVVEVDWLNEVVMVWDSSTVVSPRAGDELLRLEVVQSLPVVSMRAHARAVNDSLALVVDYGSSGSMILDGGSAVARRLSPALRDLRTRRIVGVGGAVDGPEGRIDSLTIGRQVLRGPLAFVDTASVQAVSLARADGLLGTELLRRFSLVLDYARGRAILRPTRRMQAPFCRNASGVCFERGPRSALVRVSHVEPRTPAARGGLTVGDELMTLDGVPAGELSDRELDNRLDLSGMVHVAEVRRGSTSPLGQSAAPNRGRPAARPPVLVTVRWRM